MNTIDIARQLNRDASMISRLCASYEAVRDLKTEKKIAEAIDKITHNSGLIIPHSGAGPAPLEQSFSGVV
jgi:hypothetical protein